MFLKVSTTAEIVSSAGADLQQVRAEGAANTTPSSSCTEGEDTLIAEWMLSSKTQPFASSATGKNTPNNNSSSTGTGITKRRSIPGSGDGKQAGSGQDSPLQDPHQAATEGQPGGADSRSKGHLVLLLPMCLDLALTPCDAPVLKEVAVAIIR